MTGASRLRALLGTPPDRYSQADLLDLCALLESGHRERLALRLRAGQVIGDKVTVNLPDTWRQLSAAALARGLEGFLAKTPRGALFLRLLASGPLPTLDCERLLRRMLAVFRDRPDAFAALSAKVQDAFAAHGAMTQGMYRTGAPEVPLGVDPGPEARLVTLFRGYGPHTDPADPDEILKTLAMGVPAPPSDLASAPGDSRQVNAHYQAHPYPSYAQVPPTAPLATLDRFFAAEGFARDSAVRAAPAAILVAGAGTGMTVINRRQLFPRAPITAIEPSRTSRMVAEAAFKRHGTGDVTLIDADIAGFAAGHDGPGFVLVDCHGVLMYVADAARALADLARVTAPGGYVYFSVYTTARAAAKAKLDLPAAGATVAQLLALRDRLVDDPSPMLEPDIRLSADFFTTNGFLDYVAVPHEIFAPVPQWAEWARGAGLEVIGVQGIDGVVDDTAVQARELEIQRTGVPSGLLGYLCRKPG